MNIGYVSPEIVERVQREAQAMRAEMIRRAVARMVRHLRLPHGRSALRGA